jgi:protein involved in polysaccharide export with SLBB domain
MRSKFLLLPVLLLSATFTASGQSPSDPLQSIKDTLSGGQFGGVLQNVLGNGSGKKTDKKLESPETIQPPIDEKDIIDKNIKTRDGRILRQNDQDPELRADDTVAIEMIPVEDMCKRAGLLPMGRPGSNNGSLAPGLNNAGGSSGASSLAGLSGLSGLSALESGASSTLTGPRLSTGAPIGKEGGVSGVIPRVEFDYDRCPLPTPDWKEPTDEQKDEAEHFRRRILRNNPYKLDHLGVLEIAGLPAVPLAGLTVYEATKRLNTDPNLSDWFVRLTLLRLMPTGEEALKPFGYDLFEGVPSTFAPVSDIQVPVGYIVGPGDTLVVQLYGNQPEEYELTVQRDGRIKFPKIGPIMVSGMTFDAARAEIEAHVSKQLIGSRVSITMGELRSIRVFVLGEAEKPGSYTVSGLSTMTNALFVSGGVKKVGSLRNIQLKRDGRLVSTLDLYDLLLRGDTSGDQQLLPGDVIFIPPIGDTVSVYGAVRRPAIYELKKGKTAEDAVALAGGLLPNADANHGQLERILPSRLQEMLNVDLQDAAGRATALETGDKFKIPEILPTLENSVVLSGYVYRPGQFQYHPGLRLSDVLGSFGELKPNADSHYIMIRREVPPENRIEVVSADLKRALAARGSSADPELRARDRIVVFNLSADRHDLLEPVIKDLELQATPDQPEQVVSIDGRVKEPGRYPLEPTMRVSDLIRAGGSLEDSAFKGQAELTRYSVVNGDARQTELIAVDLDGIRRGAPGADVLLKPYDRLVIKPIPMWVEPGIIEVRGEVRFPGKYPIHQGETLHSVLIRAGGFTDTAFPYGAVFVREELKKREKEQLELLANRLQSDLAALSLEAISSSAVTANGGGGGATASQGLVVGQQLLTQLREAKPVGRLVINAEGILKEPPGGPDDVVVRNGDQLVIPKVTQDITILGEVQSPTSHVYERGLTRDDYIGKSGGITQNGDRKRIYVVRANGDVVAGYRSGWFRRSQSMEMRPGDTIVVPMDTERVRALPLWVAITTIIYNLAIGFVLVHEYL